MKSGEQTPLCWEIQSMYFNGGRSWFKIRAFAIKRGSDVLDPPTGWKE